MCIAVREIEGRGWVDVGEDMAATISVSDALSIDRLA
jgi:hypothetical protein